MSWAIAAPILGNVASAVLGSNATAAANKKNAEMQKEFAQHGVRWKVADAKAAGIHPLAALNAQTHSFSPSVVGDQSWANAAQNMGQDVSRAIASTQTQQEKELSALAVSNAKADLAGKEIENQIKASQLRKMNMTSPPTPGSQYVVPGQAQSGMKVEPVERPMLIGKGETAGVNPGVDYYETSTGLAPVIPQQLSEPLEDDVIGKTMWRIRNNLIPTFFHDSPSYQPPHKSKWPKGATGTFFNPISQEWQFTSRESYPAANKAYEIMMRNSRKGGR